jgi:uncharacterized membrane protein YjgN (DUF898 family)
MSDLSFAPRVRQAGDSPVRVSWEGNPWSLAGLCLLNILLIVLTLGIYWFWARSEYRRYMWQMVRVNGEPLEYTGTGKELLIGYVKLFVFVILPVIILLAVIQLALGPQNPLAALIILPLYLAGFFLYFVGVYRANRYILTRTRWRGIAFGLEGDAAEYAWTSIWTAFLTPFTVGWLLPWRTVALRRRLTSAMRFGSLMFRFEGRPGSLYLPYAAVWLGGMLLYGAFITIGFMLAKLQAEHPGQKVTIPYNEIPAFFPIALLVALPIILVGYSWYESRKFRLFAQATKIGGLDASLDATGASVFWLTLSNSLILALSLGILRPVTQARRLRYLAKRLSFAGVVDMDAVQRGHERLDAQGAGLEAAFSIEIF